MFSPFAFPTFVRMIDELSLEQGVTYFADWKTSCSNVDLRSISADNFLVFRAPRLSKPCCNGKPLDQIKFRKQSCERVS